MATNGKIGHEGIVKSVSGTTVEVSIASLSACAACHAKGACGIADGKAKTITADRPDGDMRPGDKVTVYASTGNALYSVLIAYVAPSALILAAIFLVARAGRSELCAAFAGLALAAGYFVFLYFCRGKIARKIHFTVEKTGNY